MRRSLVSLLAALGALTVLALPVTARAGGPTSVLVTDPTSGRAAAFHYAEEGYADLERLLQEGETVPAPDGPLGETSYTVTWMVHDVAPWRLQFVHVDAIGGPYVATQSMGGDGQIGDRLTWLRLSQGKAVVQLLESALAGDSVNVVTAPPADTEPGVVERVVTETRTSWFALTGWRWALPGALLGLLVGAIAGRRRDEPRQVLNDLPAERAGVTTGVTGSLR